MKLEPSRAWEDAVAMLGRQREILLTIAGFFFFLPSLLLAALRPLTLDAPTLDGKVAQYEAWAAANIHWLMIGLAIAALGRLAILILLLSRDRPTVGEAIRAGALVLPLLLVADLLAMLPVVGGSFLFVLPGLYLLGRLILVEVAFVAGRHRNPVQALIACWNATASNGWRLFAMIAILWLGAQLLSGAAGMTVGVVTSLVAGREAALIPILVVNALVGAAFSLLLLLMNVSAYRQLAND